MSLDTSPNTNVEPTDEVSPRDALGWIYRLFYSKKLGLGLILAMSLFTLIGTILVQVPAGVRDDPELWASWLSTQRQRYGGWTDVLAALGMFNVFRSWWFIATTILLALSILACTVHRLPRLWAAATKPHVHVRDAFFDHARLRTTVTVPAGTDAAARLRAELGRRKYRVLGEDADGLYADRFRWAPFGTAIAHLAFIVILVGVLLSSLGGFRDEDFSVTAGHAREVGQGTGLTLALTSFTDDYYPDGRPKDYASEVVLTRGGTEVARQTVRVNEPLRFEGVTFYQRSFGIAAELLVTDASGKELFHDGVPLDRATDDQQNIFGRFDLSSGIEVYVIGAASGATASDVAAGDMLLEFYKAGTSTPMGQQKLSQGTPATVGGLTYTFVRERKYSAFTVARDPGTPVVWLGSGLLMLGTVMTMFFRHRRLWATIAPADDGSSVVRIASPDRADTAFDHQFHTLAASLKGHDHA